MHARKVMHAVWGMGQMQFTKFVVVVDADVDVHDYAQVAWRAFNNVDPARDIVADRGAAGRAGPLVAAPVLGRQDGHRRHAQVAVEEGHPREWPPDVVMSARRHRPGGRACGPSSGWEPWLPSPSAAAPAGGGAVQPAAGPVVAPRRRPAGRRRRADGRAALMARGVATDVSGATEGPRESASPGCSSAWSSSSTPSSRCRSRTRAPSWPQDRIPGFWRMFWITVAMVAARSLAMALNRLLDAEIDALNPRTGRPRDPGGQADHAAGLGVLRWSRWRC